MNRQSYTFALPFPTESVTHIKVSSYHRKAGINYGTMNAQKAGFCISIQPVKIEGKWETFNGFTGQNCLVEAAERDNKRKVAAWLEEAENQIHSERGIVWDMLQAVCKANHLSLELAQREPAAA